MTIITKQFNEPASIPGWAKNDVGRSSGFGFILTVGSSVGSGSGLLFTGPLLWSVSLCVVGGGVGAAVKKNNSLVTKTETEQSAYREIFNSRINLGVSSSSGPKPEPLASKSCATSLSLPLPSISSSSEK